MTYWTGSNTISGSNNLLYASSILQVKNSSTSTSFGATTANENIRLQNTDATPTNNNYSGISSYTQGGSIDAGIGFKHINHSTGESSVEVFSRNSSGSFQRLVSFANPTITFDKTVTMTLATTFSAGFTSNTVAPTFNAGFTVNTVAPTFNTALTLGSSSVGSKLTVWNDYSSTSPAQSTAFDAIHIQNRNSTNNNWASLSFYAQGGLLAGNVAAQYTDHTSGYANISIYTRGSTGSYGPVATFTANKVTQFASHTEVRSGSDLRIYDSDNTNYVAFKTPATGTLTADRTYTLPADYGSNGYQLTTDGSGGLTWTAAGGGGGGTNYQTFRDDGSDMTQRAAANFVSTSTITAALTDDSGNGETEIALSVPTDGITATQIAADAVGTSEIATDGVGAAEIAADAVDFGDRRRLHSRRRPGRYGSEQRPGADVQRVGLGAGGRDRERDQRSAHLAAEYHHRHHQRLQPYRVQHDEKPVHRTGRRRIVPNHHGPGGCHAGWGDEDFCQYG